MRINILGLNTTTDLGSDYDGADMVMMVIMGVDDMVIMGVMVTEQMN